MLTNLKYDVFISHASEDKSDVARPLAALLINAGLTVWIDEAELTLGDSLRRNIDLGLASSRFGVVILSTSFFSKEWPQKELDALVAREDGRAKVILPVWHGVSSSQIAEFSPLLADKLSVSTSRGVPYVAEAVLQAIQVQLSDAEVPLATKPSLAVGPIRISQVLGEFVDRLEARYTKSDQVTGLRTGFVDFDALVSGLKSDELHALASRPAVGTTALALNIVSNVAQELTGTVLYFSPRASASDLLVRIVGSVGKIEHRHLRALRLSEPGWQRLIAAMEVVDQLPIYIDESADITIEDILMRSRAKAQEVGAISLIVIDRLDHVAGCESPLEAEVALRQLRLLARELSSPILAVLPVLRSAESRINKRPLLTDIYCRDGVERNAHLTLFLYRDKHYNQETSDTEIAELIVARNRGGMTGMVKLRYDENLLRFENLALMTSSDPQAPDVPF